MFIYTAEGGGRRGRKRFESASSRSESAGRTESLSERMGKKGVWTARAFQFLGNSRPISARAKSTPVRRRSAASTPRRPSSSRVRPPKPMLRGIARFCTLPTPLSCRIFLHACRFPLARSRFRSRPAPRSNVRSINPRARWRVCVRAAGEKPPAMIAVYGREKPSRSADVIAISGLSRNSNCGKKNRGQE